MRKSKNKKIVTLACLITLHIFFANKDKKLRKDKTGK